MPCVFADFVTDLHQSARRLDRFHMSRPIPLTAADAANEALLVIEREYPDLETRREAVEQVVRVMRSSVLPRLETTDFASKPKW